ncbi:hypothetical protein [Shewanella surugensis]|uniref:Uncharacterized protein n=1 Tax=Shewanella surugensis TaxID=212020 RepID=A0ABT0LBC0_9GAMM|nr:hypothetical protein [Shewanella surugensis]MCL1124998.1 hypothetical protein [Shewanella surugensis]
MSIENENHMTISTDALSYGSIYLSLPVNKPLQEQMDLVFNETFTDKTSTDQRLADLFWILEQKAKNSDADSISILQQIAAKPDSGGQADCAAEKAAEILNTLFDHSALGSHTNNLISASAKDLYEYTENKIELPHFILKAALQGYLNQNEIIFASEVMNVIHQQSLNTESALISTEDVMSSSVETSVSSLTHENLILHDKKMELAKDAQALKSKEIKDAQVLRSRGLNDYIFSSISNSDL